MSVIAKIFSVIVISILFLGSPLQNVFADTAVLTDNGASSNNAVAVTSSQATTISQQNTTNIANTVSNNNTTGNNTADNNTGATESVATGDTASSTHVSNSGNTNTANASPPQMGNSSVTISGNGSGSINTVMAGANNQTTISQTNNVSVVNNGNNGDYTGENNVRNNTVSSSSLTTGNAFSQSLVGTVESSNEIVAPQEKEKKIALQIKKNASNSINTVTIQIPTNIEMLSINELRLVNTNVCYDKTGQNSLSQNAGSALLNTGNVSCGTTLLNKVNVSKIKLPHFGSEEVCQNIPPVISSSQGSSSSQSSPGSGSFSPPPSSSSSSTSSSPSSPSSSGVSLAAVSSPVSTVGQVLGVSVLPSTGSDLWQSLLFYLVIGLVGLFLRVIPQKKFSIQLLLG